MINKRLVNTVSESKKYIFGNVLCQWISLLANILLMYEIALMLGNLRDARQMMITLFVSIIALVIRYICTNISSKLSYLSSMSVKKKLREMIFEKLYHLGSSYKEKVNTSEIVQVAVEGVDQLETYFGSYLPQFFYAMLAPLTLFVVLCFVNVPSAVVLLVCVPLIPITIVIIQKWAKKLLSRYWDQYSELGDTFLENLQGLTTSKIYRADEYKHQEMNKQSERFRKITMKVLTMQLNSITIMDIVAYGGAALGVILSLTQYRASNVDLSGCLLIILLAADFFLPMRMLGSYFHIAMNGMAASEKIFRLLDLKVDDVGGKVIENDYSIKVEHLNFSYDVNREILHDVSMSFPMGSFTAIVGESGCGKSTLAGILVGRNKGYLGDVSVGGVSLKEVGEASLMDTITYISHASYIFKGSVRDNLLLANPKCDEQTLWKVLERVNLASFLKEEGGLDTMLNEKGSNLSGGQCQRLALARALLHDSRVYIFDEATSNIDVESENDIMKEIHNLAKTKTVILISHRLANVENADNIYVLDKGSVVEYGKHEDLLKKNGVYKNLWTSQQELEKYVGGK